LARKSSFTDKVWDAVDANAIQTSNLTNVLQNSDNMSLHCKFSGAVDGTFKVEATNFIPASLAASDYIWYELDFGSALTLTADTECQILLTSLPFCALRFVWTPSSAVGVTLTANLTSKTVGS